MLEADDATLGAPAIDAPRCIDCAYCLIGLPESRCPECSRAFDLTDPSTYSTKPPLIRWRLWLPGLLLASGLGVVIFLAIFTGGLGIGWAATLASPVCIGVILGYRCRVRPLAYILLVLTALIGIFVALFSLQATGVVCALIACCVLFGPMLVGALLGALLGRLLGWRLKESGFSQRSHLPVLLLFFLPITLAAAEKLAGFAPVRTAVETSRVLQIPVDRAWQSIRYFEQVQGPRPLLFRLGSIEPTGTHGFLTQQGDIQVCEYRNGWVTKKLRTKEYGRAIVFDVIEQEIGFERSVRLLSGSFRFEALGAMRTRLTLRTDYEALLSPRVCWAPFEDYVLRTLHDYILDGIEREASAQVHISATPRQLSYDSR